MTSPAPSVATVSKKQFDFNLLDQQYRTFPEMGKTVLVYFTEDEMTQKWAVGEKEGTALILHVPINHKDRAVAQEVRTAFAEGRVIFLDRNKQLVVIDKIFKKITEKSKEINSFVLHMNGLFGLVAEQEKMFSARCKVNDLDIIADSYARSTQHLFETTTAKLEGKAETPSGKAGEKYKVV